MVWSRERDAERPPLSVILPRFYLGAERDVTQDRLASLDISYVLSVNRCSPQPSFLPGSRYLRIPIDDSLWDDLLPWIPQALHFIDAAMSSGASVLVHCAAGISRSPALAVAYIMYSLGMDLDHAYRFVKERRPSISPNFNFLGQLQHFQGTLRQNGDLLFQRLDPHQPPADSNTPTGHSIRQQPGGDSAEVAENSCHTDKTQQRLSHPDGTQRPSLSLNLTLNQNKQQEASGSVTKPTQLQLPACSASLLEKRKSLSLCLTPLGTRPPSPDSQREARAAVTSTAAVHKRETAAGEQRESGSGGGGGAAGSFGRVEDSLRERSPTRAKEQGVLSPLSFTLNKLLGWGERVLLGGVFVPPVRMGQPALPYRC